MDTMAVCVCHRRRPSGDPGRAFRKPCRRGQMTAAASSATCIPRASYSAQNGMDATEADKAAHIVLRAEYCFICLNAYPYSSGHVMVIPYEHRHELNALSEAATGEMMQMARRTEAVLHEVYRPQGVNMGINLGKAAGAGVAEHLHMHILPRWLGDTNFMTVIGETRVLPETLDITWERLREGFLQDKAR